MCYRIAYGSRLQWLRPSHVTESGALAIVTGLVGHCHSGHCALYRLLDPASCTSSLKVGSESFSPMPWSWASSEKHVHAGISPSVSHARPFEPSIKSHFGKISPTFGVKCPRNGSTNEEMAPRTRTGYPHIGLCVGDSRGEHPNRYGSRNAPV